MAIRNLQPSLPISDKESPLLFELFNPPLTPEAATGEYVWIAKSQSPLAPASPSAAFNSVYEVCEPIETQTPPGRGNIVPGGGVKLHWNKSPRQKLGSGDLGRAKVTVLEPPRQGTLTDTREIDGAFGPIYLYNVKPGTPNGTEDRIVFLIEIDGERLKVIERLILVFNSTPDSKECNGKDYYVRRISYLAD